MGKSAEKWGEWLRVVKNGEKWRKIATCKWQKVGKSGEKLGKVQKVWLKVAKCG